MGLFDKYKEPIFIKENSSAKTQLEQLDTLMSISPDKVKALVAQEAALVKAGIAGEDNIAFELRNSHIPMMVLHDLYITHGDLSAQIDYLLVTRGCIFVLECKNLIGDIEITRNGDFVRTIQMNGRAKKEGIYSPITQNRRHLELIKKIREQTKSNFLTKALFEKDFYTMYRSVIVLSNPKTILNDRYAPKALRDQVIRADQLAEYIRKCNASPEISKISESSMEELAQFFLRQHQEIEQDYTEKYRKMMEEETTNSKVAESKSVEIVCPKCGAPMVKRKAAKGNNVGQVFYGCSRFPRCRGIVNVESK